jgi:hypothetical protein
MSNEFSIIMNLRTAEAITKLNSFIASAESGFKNLTATLLGLGGVASFSFLTKEAVNFADEMQHVGQIVGVAANQMAGLSLVAEKEDLELGQLKMGLKEFAKEMVATGRGGQNLIDTLIQQADKYKMMEDGTRKLTMATEDFGRSGQLLIPLLNKGSEEIRVMMERGELLSGITKENAKTADDFNDNLAELKFSVRGLALSFLNDLLPVLSATIKSAADNIVKFREWAKASDTFRISVQALITLLGTLAAFRLGNFALTGFATMIGAGAITSLRDFAAALQLIPAAASAVAASIGVITASIVAMTAALVVAIEHWKMWRDIAAKADSDVDLTKSVVRFEKFARDRVKIMQEAGMLEEKAVEEFTTRINKAMTEPDAGAASYGLGKIVQDLRKIQGEATQGDAFQWTRQLLETEDKLIDLDRQEEVLRQKRSESWAKEIGDWKTFLMILDDLDKQQKLNQRESLNYSNAFEQGAITQLEYDKKQSELNKDDLRIEQDKLKVHNDILATKIKIIEADITLTGVQKREARGVAFKEFNERNYVGAAKPYNEQDLLPGQRRELGADPNSVRDQFTLAMVGIQDEWGTWSQQLAGAFKTNFTGALQSVSTNISALILQTKTWGQALQAIGVNILTSVVNAIVEMGVKWVATHVLMAGAKAAFHAIADALGWQSAAQVNAQEASKAPALAANAATASVSSYGAAAVIGIAALVAALGIGVAAASGAFRAKGGPVSAGQPYIVGEERPELFVPNVDGYILPSVPSPQGSVASIGGGGSEVNMNVNVHNWNDEAALTKHIRDNPEVNHIILDKVKRSGHVVGIRS